MKAKTVLAVLITAATTNVFAAGSEAYIEQTGANQLGDITQTGTQPHRGGSTRRSSPQHG